MRTNVVIDDDLLESALKLSGFKTKKDAIEEGFRNIRGLVHEGVPEDVFFALSLDGHIPQRIVEFHARFKADGRPEGAPNALPART